MPIAIVTIREVDKQEPGYMHLFTKDGKAWNCNKPELFDILLAGERVKIDYNETEPKGGRKYGSKYINRARTWQEDDGPNTWPDKEPYTGGGYASKQGGKNVSKDYDPEIGKRQTAANCAMSYCTQHCKELDELAIHFPAVADIVLTWVNERPKSDAGTATEDFGF